MGLRIQMQFPKLLILTWTDLKAALIFPQICLIHIKIHRIPSWASVPKWILMLAFKIRVIWRNYYRTFQHKCQPLFIFREPVVHHEEAGIFPVPWRGLPGYHAHRSTRWEDNGAGGHEVASTQAQIEPIPLPQLSQSVRWPSRPPLCYRDGMFRRSGRPTYHEVGAQPVLHSTQRPRWNRHLWTNRHTQTLA